MGERCERRWFQLQVKFMCPKVSYSSHGFNKMSKNTLIFFQWLYRQHCVCTPFAGRAGHLDQGRIETKFTLKDGIIETCV